MEQTARPPRRGPFTVIATLLLALAATLAVVAGGVDAGTRRSRRPPIAHRDIPNRARTAKPASCGSG